VRLASRPWARDSVTVTSPVVNEPPAAGTPTDQDAQVCRHGASDVRIGVLSMSARSPDGDDARYLEWHTLDHLPEQHRISGMRSGARWVSTPACRAARAAEAPPYDAVDHVVAYLFADPVDAGLDTFFALGADLRAAGRMPVRLPAVELGGYELAGKAASPRVLVGADVLPWRPCRGIYLLLERGPLTSTATLLDVPGVAGIWSYAGSDLLHPRLADTAGKHLAVAYLDDDPAATAGRLADTLAARWSSGALVPLLAAPFVTLVPWAWDGALPG
jgi:hypothetical protein